MYLDINTSLLVLIGWFLRASYQLECLQCTSPIRRVSSNWEHSCLDGTLKPLICFESTSTNNQSYQQCVSALYRGGQRGVAGVVINRGCSYNPIFQHDCDPDSSLLDFDKTDTFYCSYTCSYDGCNRHSVDDILENGTRLSQTNEMIFFYCFYSVLISSFGRNLFS